MSIHNLRGDSIAFVNVKMYVMAAAGGINLPHRDFVARLADFASFNHAHMRRSLLVNNTCIRVVVYFDFAERAHSRQVK